MQIHELPSGTPDIDDALPFDTGGANYKAPFSSFEVGENTATFESSDEADPQQFKTVDPVVTGPIKTILKRLSMAVSNVRYIWKVLSAVVSKTAIINYDETAGTFSVYYDDLNRFILNKGGENVNRQARIDIASSSALLHDTNGVFDLHVGSGINHRLYISNGTGQGYTEQTVLRCGDSWLAFDPYNQYAQFRYGDNYYISIINTTNEKVINCYCGDVRVQLNNVTKRCNITASGGLYVNGSRVGN